ncbi:MAG: Gfo/Idh/MocA family protein [Bdellovibrionales bacterium]
MKVVILGLGIQGKKRLAVAGSDAVTTVDPVVDQAAYRRIEDVPLDSYNAAVVCTPDQYKIDILRYLLKQGKHVLVEKPLVAERNEDLRELKQLAEKNRVTCWTAYNHRFEPNLVRLREVVQSGALGKIHHVSFFYGNGTAADVRRSPWRDKGMGVIPDLGSHLLDLTDFIFGARPDRLTPWALHRFENQAYDHVVLGAQRPISLQFEMTLMSWRNSFRAEVVGEFGSAHVNCLCKWGPSSLTLRKRIFPSGKPTEHVETLEQPDPTWVLEYQAFKEMCQQPRHGIDKDLWINTILNQLENEDKELAWVA